MDNGGKINYEFVIMLRKWFTAIQTRF
jgi:hypothetical protein